MKKLLFLSLLALSGCTSTNITDLAREVKGDPAIITGQINSIYATVKFSRVGSVTNCLVTVSPDGTITVDGRQNALQVPVTANVKLGN